jgi:ABC-type uncharacterized transport system substrate-binding protein
LLNGLRAAGYGGPEQIEIVLRTSEGDPTLVTPLVAEVVERNVDVILAISSVMVQAFRQATAACPMRQATTASSAGLVLAAWAGAASASSAATI